MVKSFVNNAVKSSRNGLEKTLLDHTVDVLQTYRAIFGHSDEPNRMAACWRRFFKLTDNEWRAFHACAVPAIIFHDLGKANSGFQKAVSNGDRDAQLVRHEHLSALILFDPKFRQWLDSLSDCLPDVVISAVVGHHLKAVSGRIGTINTDPIRSTFTFYRKGFDQLLRIAKYQYPATQSSITGILIPKMWSYDGPNAVDFTTRRKELESFLRWMKRRLRKNDSLKRIHIAVRAALIVADSAASGLTHRRGLHRNPYYSAADSANQIVGKDVRLA